MPAAESGAYPLGDLFNFKVDVPGWATERIRAMEKEKVMQHATIGHSMWQWLVYKVLFHEAGTTPSRTMAASRQALTDNKATLAQIATVLGLNHPSDSVSGNDLVCCLLYVISKDGADEAAAEAWLSHLIQPSVGAVKRENAERVRIPAAPTRSTQVLRNFRELNRRTISELETREDDPYSLPKDPFLVSTASLDPGQAMMFRMLVDPALSASLLEVAQRASDTRSSPPVTVAQPPPTLHTRKRQRSS
ncbi:hypothetical protein B0H11DRAFT_354829 [Mycena galericulata]|nr:hypothetical protein B0H11DRAFT_354829 [Mycena galericulata]